MIITITSGKGGTGKTTAVSAIGSCIAAMGKRTLCIDMDFDLPNLDLALGMNPLSLADLGDVVNGRCTVSEAVTEHPDIKNLFFLSVPSDGGAKCFPKANDEVFREIDAEFDFCLIDSPAGLGDGFHIASANADKVIVITTLDATSLRDSQRVVMELDENGAQDIYLMANRVSSSIFRRTLSKIDDMIDFIGAPLIGIVCEDRDVLLASARSKALVLESDNRAAKAFLRIARRLLDEKVPLKCR